MATPTIQAFWNQLAASGKVDADRLSKLAAEYNASQGNSQAGSLQELVIWLIAQRVVSLEECQALARSAGQTVSPPPPPAPAIPTKSQVSLPPNEMPRVEPLRPASPAAPDETMVADTTSRLSQRYETNKRKKPWPLIAVGLIAVIVIAGAAMVLLQPNNVAGDPQHGATAEQSSETSHDAIPNSPADSEAPKSASDSIDFAEEESSIESTPTAAPREIPIADDGETLWSSPTAGDSPALRSVPPGTQLILMLRPAELFRGESGESLRMALGPAGSRLAAWLKAATDLELLDIERLDFMLGESEEPSSLLAVVVYPKTPLGETAPDERWKSKRLAALDAAQMDHKALDFDFPANDRIVIASSDVLKQLQEFGEAGAPLSPPMQQLLESADQDRHCNVLFVASYVRSQREALYGEYLAPLREGIDWMLGSGDEIQAGLISCHLEDRLFAELRLFGIRDILPRILARQLHGRIEQAPRRVKDHLKTLSIHTYSRDALWDFPEMLQSVARYSRYDRDGRQGVLRCYLPASAAGHLTSAIELTLWETARGGAGEGIVEPASRGPAPRTLEEKLTKITSLSFDRSSLDKSLQILSEDIGIPIVILGGDLQLDGITKNQSFGIEMNDRPAREILNAIVQLANPDKTANTLSDAAQKLIYVLKENYQEGDDTIVITTRAQAAKRQDELPPEFVGPQQN